ncbi:MAG: hypothetical protein WA268_26540, partial [Xanthobacteraceae bacterium]
MGKPSGRWTYPDAAGAVLGYVLRFDPPAADKTFRPLTLWRNATTCKPEWRWESWPPKRPLYGLQQLAERHSAPVVVCEGEKAADAAAQLLPGFVVVTSPNGSKGAGQGDWSPLKGRVVTVWPDADPPGHEYARQVPKGATVAGALSVAIVSPPADVKVGWDAADALAEGWDEARTMALITAAVPIGSKSKTEIALTNRSTIKQQPSRREQRADFVERVSNLEGVELWRDPSGETYATVPINRHLENLLLKSRGFERWLTGFYHDEKRDTLTSQAMGDMLRTFDIKAYKGDQYHPFIRVGEHEGNLYHDLGDDGWRCVEITSREWRVIEKAPVKFLRSPSMLPLPEPKKADGQRGSELLRRFMPSVASNEDFNLIAGWCVAALRHRGPFTILIVNGTEDAGKSTL